MGCPTDKKEGGAKSDIDNGLENTADVALDSDKTYDLSKPQEVFLRFIDCLSWPQGKSPFQDMLDVEEHPDESIALESRINVHNAISRELPNYSMDLDEIRSIACTLFGSVESAWSSYQIYSNTAGAEKRFHDSNIPPPPTDANKQTTGKKAELVADISKDKRFFMSSDFGFPATLPDTIKAQFLRVVEQKGWWEALALTYLSRQGCHAIFYNDVPDIPGQYPFLLSSTLVQDVPVNHANTLLIRSPLFRGEGWKITLNREQIVRTLEEYMDEIQGKTKAPVDLKKITDNPVDNGDLEESIITAVGAENINEMIRLTCSEPNGWRNCYEGIRHFSELQADSGVPFSISATYKDLANAFEVLGRLHGKPCHMVLSERRIKEDEPVTQKYLLLHGNIREAMERYNWRTVGMLLQKMNRGDADIHSAIAKCAIKR